ncbi:hypothetical protein ASG47_19820 [Devosia sp. Leaf420]|nr:hypothetical protein ASG47_19820 [Devosia sp. Leaf420]
MAFLDGEVWHKVVHPSGHKTLEVVLRPDGVGRFVEWTQEHDEYSGDYWAPSFESGLYSSAEDALAEAHKVLGWLKAAD